MAPFGSDQYALGVVMYEWLCGERPFTGSFVEIASQHMLAAPSSLRQKVPVLSPAVEQVVFKALSKDPAQRFENVLALSSALTNAVQDSSTIYVPQVESARQPHTLLLPPAPVTLSTIQLPDSPTRCATR
jgi:eukaryotic-like serine/threonine-protein kinase